MNNHHKFWKAPSNKVFELCCGKCGFVVDIIERFMNGLAEIISDKKERYKHIVEKQMYFADIIEINIWKTRTLLNPSEKNYKLNYSLTDLTKQDLYEKWHISNFNAVITNQLFNKQAADSRL